MELTAQSLQNLIDKGRETDFTTLAPTAEVHTLAVEDITPPLYQIPGDNRPYIKVNANGTECFPLMDSGAMVCVVSYVHENELEVLNGILELCNFTVSTLQTDQQQVTGMMWLTYEMGSEKCTIPTLIMKANKSHFIVGIDFMKAFGICFVKSRAIEKLAKSQILHPALTQ